MDNTNLDLFKQALSEGLNNRFQRDIDSCSENVICSRQHRIAMKAIIRGRDTNGKVWSPRMRKMAAILVAAALLLVSCAIVYRNEIRDFIEEIYESFAIIKYSEGENEERILKETYELTYIPEGYWLENSNVSSLIVKYSFKNSSGGIISFEQFALDGIHSYVDIENGYTLIINVNNCDIYYKNSEYRHYYIWNDGKYAMSLFSTVELSTDELNHIINGIQIK